MHLYSEFGKISLKGVDDLSTTLLLRTLHINRKRRKLYDIFHSILAMRKLYIIFIGKYE